MEFHKPSNPNFISDYEKSIAIFKDLADKQPDKALEVNQLLNRIKLTLEYENGPFSSMSNDDRIKLAKNILLIAMNEELTDPLMANGLSLMSFELL